MVLLNSEVQFILLILLVVLFIFATKRLIRYNKGREFMLKIICFLQGINTQWIRDPFLSKHVLKSFESKGSGIEAILSVPAWHPILSLESVDGDQWRRMKKSFLTILTHLPAQQNLGSIVTELLQNHLNSGQIIDSRVLVHLIIASMVQWLFERPFKPEWEFVCDTSWEWRKEIAIKGKADMSAKLRVVEWMKQLIFESKYYQIFGDKWNDPEYYSLFLQPFLISPAINISDIAVTLQSDQFLKKLKEIDHPFSKSEGDNKFGGQINDDHIVYAINMTHPFPILERYLPNGLRNNDDGEFIVKPNTQVFMPVDEIGFQSAEFGTSHWIAFGAGKRQCAGRDIALALSVPLFSQLLHHPNFKPGLNHIYSGRNNDTKEDWVQFVYQLKRAVIVISRLVKQKLKAK